MIEKKISYKEPKPTKVPDIKPVKQGGRLNYLGKQKTVTAPIKWKSGPTHPVTHLAYITDEEEKVLVKLNMYKSMNGKPNKGPFGIVSLNDGDGSGGGGDSGGGSGGSGGSDAAGDAGNATGDSGGVGGSGDSTDGAGAGSGPGGEAGTGGVGGVSGGIGGSEEGFGIGPNDSIGPSMSQPADEIDTAPTEVDPMDPAIDDSRQVSMIKTLAPFSLDNPNRSLVSRMAQITGPVGIALGLASSLARGVTNPDDYSQVSTSVQSPAPTGQSTGNGQIVNANTGIQATSIASELVDELYKKYSYQLNRV